jgi:hypothetical protein
MWPGGHGAPDLEQQLIMRVLTHGAVQTLDLTAAGGEFVEPEPVMDIMARQAIRSGHQDPLTRRHGGTVPPALPSRTVALGPPLAIIPVDVLLCERPLGMRGHLGVEALQWRLHGLHWLWTVGRHTHIAGDVQGTPPAGVLVQDPGLPHAPWPTAAGTDRPHPTDARRHAVRLRSDESAQTASWDPPAQSAYPTQEDPLLSGVVLTGSVLQPQGAPPPGQLEGAPPDAAEFVICDCTIEPF